MRSLLCFLIALPGLLLLFFPNLGKRLKTLLDKWTPKRTLRQEKAGGHRFLPDFEGLRERCRLCGADGLFRGFLLAAGLVGIGGFLSGLFLGIPLLALPLAFFLCLFLFLVFGLVLTTREAKLEGEMEVALTLVTSSYLRCGVLVEAVSENLTETGGVLRRIFAGLVRETSVISANEKSAVLHMKQALPHPLFGEWCDTLLLCLEDRQMKPALSRVVDRLSEARLANLEVMNAKRGAMTEYAVMAVMALGNVPLMALLNEEWFRLLTETLPGQLTLGGILLVLAGTEFWIFRALLRKEEAL